MTCRRIQSSRTIGPLNVSFLKQSRWHPRALSSATTNSSSSDNHRINPFTNVATTYGRTFILCTNHKCSSFQKAATATNQSSQITQKGILRFFSQSSHRSMSHDSPQRLKVAIIGGGASGLSAALHLAPLVSKGLIAKPIDVYEQSTSSLAAVQQDTDTNTLIQGKGTRSGAFGRDIGVGIWNTALEPFKKTNGRKSHLELIEKLENLGQYVGEVGYRTPKGKWLTKSKLCTEPIQAIVVGDDRPNVSPSLLFLRERDFLSCLREAVQMEQETFGTIQMHYGRFNNDQSTCVQDIILCDNNDDAEMSSSVKNGSRHADGLSGKLKFADGTVSDHSYHFIIAADGMNSILRTKYAGYDSFINRWKSGNDAVSTDSDKWQREEMEEKHSIEDRNYVVFRGNSPLTNEQANMNGISFQTWGEGRNMRFAAVGMSHPQNSNDSLNAKERCEKQVWFATICDDELCSIKDPQKRKDRLIENFQDWHEPICCLIDSTPADDILMERGLGHKHSIGPVLNMTEVIHYQARSNKGGNSGPTASQIMPYQIGPGPILLFSGDSYMTVDPVLAQGFSIGMEGAADLASTLETCLQNRSMTDAAAGGDNDASLVSKQIAFDPNILRNAIMERNSRRFERIMCLIRSTELVQTMAQPTSMWASMLVKNILRPLMMIAPSSFKEVAFSVVMKYSLGYYGHGGDKLASSKTKE
mmetsp:Transcript_8082/g.15219  ORF Transcript_8082/g.15219 Transcript_8082/m.15219 type:complete len:699 (-) Transcript_8082:117-2213(-)